MASLQEKIRSIGWPFLVDVLSVFTSSNVGNKQCFVTVLCNVIVFLSYSLNTEIVTSIKILEIHQVHHSMPIWSLISDRFIVNLNS